MLIALFAIINVESHRKALALFPSEISRDVIWWRARIGQWPLLCKLGKVISFKDFKNGKDRAIGFLVGQIMKQTRGKANPKMVNKLLNQELQNR